jgi:predicted permease
VTPGFLDSIGVHVLRGRGITADDTANSRPVAVVNESFVKRFLPGEDPIGKHFGINGPQYAGAFEIVGVIPDFKMNDPRTPPHRLYLRPFLQRYTGFQDTAASGETRSMFLHSVILHFKTPQQNVDETIRRTMQSVDPNLTIADLRPYDAQVADNFTQDRLLARLATLFGLLALVLASVGLYGVMSYLVVRRTGEIGIRMALGATRGRVLGIILQGALLQILIGFALGIPAALIAGQFMASELFGVKAYDPLALLGAVLVLAVCAGFAGFIPARRAASIEPMQALRTE